MAGQKAGELVEQTVKNVMSGKGEEQKAEGAGGAGGAEGAEGKKQGGGEGGFGLDDALSMVGGKKEGGGDGGLDIKNFAGGLFK